MPDKSTLKRLAKDRREGKSVSTQAGEFVREEIEHIREGMHGARSAKQAIAIGLSKARRAGVKLPVPKKGTVSESARKKAQRENAKGKTSGKPSAKRFRATIKALKREGSSSVSESSLAKQTRSAARKRTSSERSAAAKKAAATKGPRGRSVAAKKAAKTRARKA